MLFHEETIHHDNDDESYIATAICKYTYMPYEFQRQCGLHIHFKVNMDFTYTRTTVWTQECPSSFKFHNIDGIQIENARVA